MIFYKLYCNVTDVLVNKLGMIHKKFSFFRFYVRIMAIESIDAIVLSLFWGGCAYEEDCGYHDYSGGNCNKQRSWRFAVSTCCILV